MLYAVGVAACCLPFHPPVLSAKACWTLACRQTVSHHPRLLGGPAAFNPPSAAPFVIPQPPPTLWLWADVPNPALGWLCSRWDSFAVCVHSLLAYILPSLPNLPPTQMCCQLTHTHAPPTHQHNALRTRTTHFALTLSPCFPRTFYLSEKYGFVQPHSFFLARLCKLATYCLFLCPSFLN